MLRAGDCRKFRRIDALVLALNRWPLFTNDDKELVRLFFGDDLAVRVPVKEQDVIVAITL